MMSSRQFALSDALCHAEFSSGFNGLMSFSTARSQEVAKRQGRRFHSGRGLCRNNSVMIFFVLFYWVLVCF